MVVLERNEYKMAKLQIDVQLPSIAKSYEFLLDDTMSVGKVKRDFIKQIEAVEGRQVFEDATQVLFSSKNLGGLLSDNEILGSMEIKSGDTIILI